MNYTRVYGFKGFFYTPELTAYISYHNSLDLSIPFSKIFAENFILFGNPYTLSLIRKACRISAAGAVYIKS